YEDFLNRGKRSGHPRDPWETPLEYAERLRECYREVVFPNKEIGQLTDIFVKAHYGREPVNDQQVQQSEALFNKIRQSL
ncbi:MAG TPA: DUF4129 domain-containing protein, partial [Clostridia bacterium]|nr:DUF4129 domain-containing protein [Clostridia bacterium]